VTAGQVPVLGLCGIEQEREEEVNRLLGRSGDDGAHLVLALHVRRARAVDFFDFSGCMCFAAALDKNVTLWKMLVLMIVVTWREKLNIP
jgi:hypothetical protein